MSADRRVVDLVVEFFEAVETEQIGYPATVRCLLETAEAQGGASQHLHWLLEVGADTDTAGGEFVDAFAAVGEAVKRNALP